MLSRNALRDHAETQHKPPKWNSRFQKNCQITVCDSESSGRPSSSLTDINADKSRDVIHDDRLGTVPEH